MPRKLQRDEMVAAAIRAAIKRIEAGEPETAKLQTRAARGTLKMSPTTVAIEAGVDRHLIGSPNCLYAAEHALIAALMAKRGTSPSLRRQLDEARREKREALDRLERSRTVSIHLLTRMHKQDLEMKRLQEEIASREIEEEPVIGTGRVSVLPVRQRPNAGSTPPGVRR